MGEAMIDAVRRQVVMAGGHEGDGPDYYRVRLPGEWLRRRGFAVDFVYNDLNQNTVAGASVVMIQRGWHPFLVLAIEVLRQWGIRTVYELDDDIWAIPEWNPLRVHFTPEHLRGMENCMRLCDGVIVSTHPLAGLVARFNPSVWVCPNGVDLDRVPPREAPRRPGVRIGWAGSGTHGADLMVVAPVLKRVMRARPEVTAVFMGALPPGWEAGERVEHHPWVASRALFEGYRALDLDMALAPLVPCRFNASKSPVKALEAAALGLPIVASDLGPYRCLASGSGGLLVPLNDPYGWEEAILGLVDDPERRLAMGQAARAWVEKAATLDQTGPSWVRALGIAAPRSHWLDIQAAPAGALAGVGA